MPQTKRVRQTNQQVSGADEVWQQFVRVGTVVARCAVERLMRRFFLTCEA
jgi:putative transposase